MIPFKFLQVFIVLLLYSIFIFLPMDSVRRVLLDDTHTYHRIDCRVLGEIRTCLKEFPVTQCSRGFLWILFHWICCLFEATEQRLIIIVKRLIQRRSNVTRAGVECGKKKKFQYSFLCLLRYFLKCLLSHSSNNALTQAKFQHPNQI